MKWLKKRRGDDVVDLTHMNIPQRPAPRETVPVNAHGMVDLSQTSPPPSPTPTQNTTSVSPNMDFLGSMASASQTPQQQPSTPSPGNITSTLRAARGATPHAAINEVKLKVDDHDFKMQQLEKRIADLEDKLRRFDAY